MKLTKEQKILLVKIQAPFIEKESLNEEDLEILCDYITDHVMYKETTNDEVSKFGEELLSLHDDIVI